MINFSVLIVKNGTEGTAVDNNPFEIFTYVFDGQLGSLVGFRYSTIDHCI